MPPKKAPKSLAEDAARVVGRLSDDKRAELARVAAQAEEERRPRMKKAIPARVALAKLKLARLREGLSLGEVSARTGIERGNLSRLENHVDNVELNTLVRLADALGYDVLVELKKRSESGRAV